METKIQPRVGILVPTRGLIFTQVEEYIENVRSTYPNIRVFRTHDLPIPNSFNHLVELVLQDPEIKYVWWIEEDIIPPDKTLDKFFIAMDMGFDIAAVDYGFNGGFNTIVRSEPTTEILFTGFGCTFMKRGVLEAFQKPIFKADKAFNLSSMQWITVDPSKVYGQFDIRFGSEAREKGFKFIQVEGECSHLQLIQLGQKEINTGCHTITEKDHIERHLTVPLANL